MSTSTHEFLTRIERLRSLRPSITLPPSKAETERALLQEIRAGRARESLIEFARYIYPEPYPPIPEAEPGDIAATGFQAAAHHYLIAEALQEVERGDNRRLVISMPPRTGKSQLVKLFQAWYLGRHPGRQLIATSATQEQADDHGREVRDMMGGGPFQDVFPGVFLRSDVTAVKRFKTEQNGIYVAAGAGGPINGRGAHLLVIDDPYKSMTDADSTATRRQIQTWYTSVARLRLMPRGAIVLVQTRWREDDLAGFVQEQYAREGWRALSLPALDENDEALWPEWYPADELIGLRKDMFPREWSAIYQQRPTAEEGGILKRGWWQNWDKPKPPEKISYVMMSVDTAMTGKTTSDYSACTTWAVFQHSEDRPAKGEAGNQRILLLDAWHERLEFADLKRRLQETYKQFKPDTVLIEPLGAGIPILQELRRAGLPVVAFKMPRSSGRGMPMLDKEARAHSAAAVLEGGLVYAPLDRVWAAEVIDECAAFPAGSHDDLVDTVTQALIRIRQSGVLHAPDDPEDEPQRRPRSKPVVEMYA